MKINKQSGLPLQIYIPNLQTIQPFEFEFYTNPTAPKTTNIVVSYDGTTYFDCASWEKGVYLYTEKKLPNDGQLLCRATYYIPSPVVPGGLQKIVMGDISTGISIVSQGGNYFDPIADPSKLKTPSFNDPTCSHIPIFMTFYPGAEKGDKGELGSIDYSILTEQIVPGEFFIDVNGVRKEVFTKTYHGDSTLNEAGDNHLIIDNSLASITLLEVRGSYAVGGTQYFNNKMNGYAIQEIASFSNKWCFRCVTEASTLRFSVYLLNTLPEVAPSIVGATVKYSINIKYVK